MSTENIYTALCAAQKSFGAVVKNQNNPAFRSKYADLSALIEAVAPALSDNGIAFFHTMAITEHGNNMVTRLVHAATGTSIECAVPLIVAKNDMQGMKSATTYAKRIGLESLTGVAPEDDDGNAAAESVKNSPRPQQAKSEPKPAAQAKAEPITAQEAQGILETFKTRAQESQTMDDLVAWYKAAYTAVAAHPDIQTEVVKVKDQYKSFLSSPFDGAPK